MIVPLLLWESSLFFLSVGSKFACTFDRANNLECILNLAFSHVNNCCINISFLISWIVKNFTCVKLDTLHFVHKDRNSYKSQLFNWIAISS